MTPRLAMIKRVLSCLRLADPNGNANEHERRAAKLAAKKLIKIHKIKRSELKTASENSATFEVISQEPSRKTPGYSAAFDFLKRNNSVKRGWDK